MVRWIGLQFVIVAFSGHTHYFKPVLLGGHGWFSFKEFVYLLLVLRCCPCADTEKFS